MVLLFKHIPACYGPDIHCSSNSVTDHLDRQNLMCDSYNVHESYLSHKTQFFREKWPQVSLCALTLDMGLLTLCCP